MRGILSMIYRSTASLASFSALIHSLELNYARRSFVIVVQVCWFSPERNIRLYPAVLDGIAERFSGPSVEFLFLDTIEKVQELKDRVTKHVPMGCEPFIRTILTCTGDLRERWRSIMASYS
jgi:hypothetical protein